MVPAEYSAVGYRMWEQGVRRTGCIQGVQGVGITVQCGKHGAVCKGYKLQGAGNNGYSDNSITHSFVVAFGIEVPFDRRVSDTQAASFD